MVVVVVVHLRPLITEDGRVTGKVIMQTVSACYVFFFLSFSFLSIHTYHFYRPNPKYLYLFHLFPSSFKTEQFFLMFLHFLGSAGS